MSIAQQDREDVNSLHTVANGTGSSSFNASKKRSHDGSDSKTPTSPWGAKPTVILTPGSSRVKERNSKSFKSSLINPFSGTNFDTLHRVAEQNSSARKNPSANTVVPSRFISQTTGLIKQTSVNRAAKKPRLEHATHDKPTILSNGRLTTPKGHRSPSPEGSSSITPAFQGLGITSSHSRSYESSTDARISMKSAWDGPSTRASSATRREVIDVDQEEDLGQRIEPAYTGSLQLTPTSSSDDLQIVSPSELRMRATSDPRCVGDILGVGPPSAQHEFNKDQAKRDVKLPSAPHTRALKENLQGDHCDRTAGVVIDRNVVDDDDPIEDSEDFDSATARLRASKDTDVAAITKNNVRNKVQYYENRNGGSSRPPEVDLREKAKLSKSRVSAMKKRKGTEENLCSFSKPSEPPKLSEPPKAKSQNQQNGSQVPVTFYLTRGVCQEQYKFPLEAYIYENDIYEYRPLNGLGPRYWLQIQGDSFSLLESSIDREYVVVGQFQTSDIQRLEITSKEAITQSFPVLAFVLLDSPRVQFLTQDEKSHGVSSSPFCMLPFFSIL
ncbi:hypothetical protein K439DRAFT_1407326 [Ramaria rubella]|nr:hypothetical protein K439DRAFT_1398788 [Ramaria rubella]KAF8587542.1 hypothetical protein K439DRAFT_1407326 [Ramaria rubella]